MGADRVELYTEPFARAFERGRGRGRASFAVYAHAATLAARSASASTPDTTWTSTTCVLFRRLPHLDEVSIGHALDQPRAVRRA